MTFYGRGEVKEVKTLTDAGEGQSWVKVKTLTDVDEGQSWVKFYTKLIAKLCKFTDYASG